MAKEATRRIRNELHIQTLPIVALTAGALVGERQRALEAGMNDFISKPFDPPALIRKVRRVVEAARGEPIPILILDEKSAALATDAPLVSCIDAGVVKQMFGDDLVLFKSLLARVLRDFVDLAVPIIVVPEDPTVRNELIARTHKLRGSAGVIGATRLMRLAAEAEEALEADRPVDIVQEILRQLATALTLLRAEADLVFAKDAEAAAGAPIILANGQNAGAADIEELCALLESQNLAAIDRFELLSPSLSVLVGALRFDRLREAINNLDFQLGAELLRKATLLTESVQVEA
jgi:CheY-like chemotaxis protein